MKIIYIFDQPFNKFCFEKFGIQVWIDGGWEVEIWDLTPWLFSDSWHSSVISSNPNFEFNGYFSINNFHDFLRRCEKIKKGQYYIDCCIVTPKLLAIKTYLSLIGLKRALLFLNVLTPSRSNNDRIKGALKKIIKLGPYWLIKTIRGLILQKILNVCAPVDLYVVSGKESIKHVPCNRDIILAHNFDYDEALKNKKFVSRNVPDYAVFIDQDSCFHPDFLQLNIAPYVTPDQYFPLLRAFFKVIESNLNLSVLVAGHPRSSRLNNDENFFGANPVIYGNTAKLIAESRLVFCHFSTALQHAVLAFKPIVFLTTDQFTDTNGGYAIEYLSRKLGGLLINIDKDCKKLDLNDAMKIDILKYQSFISAYIKSEGTPDIPLWEIIESEVKRRYLATVGYY